MFEEGLLHGQGEFSVTGGTYSLAGQFVHGVAEIEPSKYLLTVVSPEEEEEDPKAKKDNKKPPANQSMEEIEGTGNAVKIAIDTTNPVAEKRVLCLSLNIVYQGESYEDPNPPEEDEAAKKKKGGKDAAAEPEVRMITPDPVTVETESGRQFELQLGRYEQVPIETTA